jgi:hypothetical protein
MREERLQKREADWREQKVLPPFLFNLGVQFGWLNGLSCFVELIPPSTLKPG